MQGCFVVLVFCRFVGLTGFSLQNLLKAPFVGLVELDSIDFYYYFAQLFRLQVSEIQQRRNSAALLP
jgi:hypothetical protein